MKYIQIWRYLVANAGQEVKMRHIIGACFPPLTAKQRATVTQSVRAVLRKLEKSGQIEVRRVGPNVFYYKWIGRMVVHTVDDPVCSDACSRRSVNQDQHPG